MNNHKNMPELLHYTKSKINACVCCFLCLFCWLQIAIKFFKLLCLELLSEECNKNEHKINNKQHFGILRILLIFPLMF